MVFKSQERHYTIHYTIRQVYRTSVSRLAALVMEVKPVDVGSPSWHLGLCLRAVSRSAWLRVASGGQRGTRGRLSSGHPRPESATLREM